MPELSTILYITQYPHVIALTHFLAVTCPYCWRNYVWGGGIKKLLYKVTTMILAFVWQLLVQG